MIPKSSFYVPHPPPIKKTPLVGVFFIGANGEPLEISASRKGGTGDVYPGVACPERSEDVQNLSISAKKGKSRKRLSDILFPALYSSLFSDFFYATFPVKLISVLNYTYHSRKRVKVFISLRCSKERICLLVILIRFLLWPKKSKEC